MRNETFFSLAEAKEAVMKKLEELNGYPFKKREGNRREAVEVFFHGNRVASHIREKSSRRDPVTVPSHMPESHRQYLAYTKDDFLSWAESIGPNTEKFARFFLESGKAPEQGF